ncbi:MAG: hypothetical protein ACKESB_02255 [Candidatus Hodgkinia cicadicola]
MTEKKTVAVFKSLVSFDAVYAVCARGREKRDWFFVVAAGG